MAAIRDVGTYVTEGAGRGAHIGIDGHVYVSKKRRGWCICRRGIGGRSLASENSLSFVTGCVVVIVAAGSGTVNKILITDHNPTVSLELRSPSFVLMH